MNPADWPLWLQLATFVAATSVVWFSGARLARLAAAISSKTGIGQAAIGMVLLGGVTSTPELAVAVSATLQGTPLLSINDVLGSASVNVLVLAIADIAYGRDSLTTRLPSMGVVLQGVIGMMVLALVAVGTLVTDHALFGVGAGSWLVVLAYAIGIRILVKSRADDEWRPTHNAGENDKEQKDSRSLARIMVLTSVAGLVIMVAGFFLARVGDALAERTGLGASFFGAIVLAFATSTPEISTVLESVRMRRYTMAISDVFGTNLFNMTILFVVDALHGGGPVLVEAGAFAAAAALLALVLTGIYVVGMLERRDRAVMRMGYDTITVLITYCAGVVLLYGLR